MHVPKLEQPVEYRFWYAKSVIKHWVLLRVPISYRYLKSPSFLLVIVDADGFLSASGQLRVLTTQSKVTQTVYVVMATTLCLILTPLVNMLVKSQVLWEFTGLILLFFSLIKHQRKIGKSNS